MVPSLSLPLSPGERGCRARFASVCILPREPFLHVPLGGAAPGRPEPRCSLSEPHPGAPGLCCPEQKCPHLATVLFTINTKREMSNEKARLGKASRQLLGTCRNASNVE